MRRYRPTQKPLEEKGPPDDSRTRSLLRGEELYVEFDRVRPEPPWEVGEILDIVNANWVVVCQAEVLEADPPAYTLRGRLLGDVGD